MKRKKSYDQATKKRKQKVEESEEEIDEEDGFTSLVTSLSSSKKIIKKFLTDEDETVKPVEVEEDDEIIESENESEIESSFDEADDSDEDSQSSTNDPFKVHFEQNIDAVKMEKLVASKMNLSEKKKMSGKEHCDYYTYPAHLVKELEANTTSINANDQELVEKAYIKEQLVDQWNDINIHKKKNSAFTAAQLHLFPTIASYQDLYYSNRNFGNGEEIRRLYCLHVVNHALKSSMKVLKNNARITAAAKDEKEIDDCRDQGLTRPKILILVPFRDSCLKIVNNIISIALKGAKGQVMNKKRFQQEFSLSEEVKNDPSKPDDFKRMFQGNTDDCFRIGLNISKKNIKLYCPFYSADVIIASPLGLRTIIGSESEVQEFDFLSSIEMLIMDQTDVFLMQNWEHVLHIMDHMNKLPQKDHGTDFSRVRMWCVDNRSKYYRQTLLFSSIQSPEINSIFNKYSQNFNGKVKRAVSIHMGCVQQVVNQIPQVYEKIPCKLFQDAADRRFNYFIQRILPSYRNGSVSNIGIFIPSYFDFVRVRNYFKKEEISFVQISEYSQRSNISRARSMFLEKRKSFILFTERFYFFYRYKIRGIKTLILYELPRYPEYYSELVNYMESKDSESTCKVLFTKFDGSQLEGVVGSAKCQQMLVSPKDTFMVVTES